MENPMHVFISMRKMDSLKHAEAITAMADRNHPAAALFKSGVWST
jgi:hypothetical protein